MNTIWLLLLEITVYLQGDKHIDAYYFADCDKNKNGFKTLGKGDRRSYYMESYHLQSILEGPENLLGTCHISSFSLHNLGTELREANNCSRINNHDDVYYMPSTMLNTTYTLSHLSLPTNQRDKLLFAFYR